MAFDTFMVIAGVYHDVESAEADYELVQELHRTEGLMDAYDAAVIHRREDGKLIACVHIGAPFGTPNRARRIRLLARATGGPIRYELSSQAS